MGLDEAGRGCLSGPVVAAGVIIRPGTELNAEIRDSKKIKKKERERLAEEIRKNALFWTIRHCPPEEIDRINILQASLKAMLMCSEAKKAEPDFLLIDGNRFTASLVPVQCVVGGDDMSASIGAASILAKVYRDDLMQKLHQKYPCYDWDRNVGYPTKTHFEGLRKYGISEFHRRSFRLRTDKILTRDFGKTPGAENSKSLPSADEEV